MAKSYLAFFCVITLVVGLMGLGSVIRTFMQFKTLYWKE